jgi:hypothetical protein
VGNFSHFRCSGVQFWDELCSVVEEQGAVIPAAAALLGDQ